VRIAFFGTPEPAVPSLEALLADAEVDLAAVVSNPDRPRGRGHKLAASPVKAAALAAGVPVWQPARAREILQELRALEVDACAVVAYGSILPPDVLAAGGRGFVNLHFSLLPAWRGAAPVQHSLLAGDEVTGVSCFVLDEGMDTGPVLCTRAVPIAAGETAGELVTRLSRLGAPLLVEAVKGVVTGTLVAQPQDHGRATYAPKISPEQAALDWTRDASGLERAVRAFNPVPGAHTELDGTRLKIHRSQVVPLRQAPEKVPPGTVVRLDADGPVVACGRDALRLEEVQPAGRPRMSGGAFANGYRPAGRRLGPSAPVRP
jgi:methionyl-tRNA formyltransferase